MKLANTMGAVVEGDVALKGKRLKFDRLDGCNVMR